MAITCGYDILLYESQCLKRSNWKELVRNISIGGKDLQEISSGFLPYVDELLQSCPVYFKKMTNWF